MPVPALRRLLPLGLLCALALPASASADATGTQIVSWLNAQRAAQGFPADLTEDTALSRGCAQHDHYGALNGTLGHSEDPAKPGYSADGNAAAQQAVVYSGTTWSPGVNPFETAPIHLAQLLSPYLARVGGAESEGYGCVTTLAAIDHAPAAADTVFSYPADGATRWRASEVDSEGPFTPGQTVGIAAGTRTGPTLYALVSGPGVSWGSSTKLVSATLTGPSGPVPFVAFDTTSPQVGRYLPAGAQLLPRAPLAAGARYTAAVRMDVTADDGTVRTFAKTWSFTTAGTPLIGPGTAIAPTATGITAPAAGKACRTALRFSGLGRTAAGSRRLRVRATACRATTLRVTLRRGGRTVLTRTAKVRPGSRTVNVVVPRSVPAGTYAIRVRMAGATLSFARRLAAG